jgi:hypothetical protein
LAVDAAGLVSGVDGTKGGIVEGESYFASSMFVALPLVALLVVSDFKNYLCGKEMAGNADLESRRGIKLDTAMPGRSAWKGKFGARTHHLSQYSSPLPTS